MTTIIAAVIVAGVTTSLAMPGTIRLLRRLGIIDMPNVRSSHVRPIPRGAGLAVGAGMAAGLIMHALSGHSTTVALPLALCAFLVLGFGDDIKPLSAGVRLAAQAILALWLVITIGVEGIGKFDFVWAAWAVALASVIALVNAVNFMDGINGISSATGIVACTWYVYVGIQFSNDELVVVASSLLGALAAFAPWNSPRAFVFLGDSGSYLLGGTVAAMALISWQSGASPVVALAPMALYLADTGVTLLRRAWRRQSIFKAHREHTYQRLTDCLGQSHVKALVVVVAFTVLCVATVAVLQSSHWAAAVALLLIVGLYIASPRLVSSIKAA